MLRTRWRPARLSTSSLTADRPGKRHTRWFFQSQATTKASGTGGHLTTRWPVARSHGARSIATLSDQWGECDDGGYKTETWYADGYKQVGTRGDRALP